MKSGDILKIRKILPATYTKCIKTEQYEDVRWAYLIDNQPDENGAFFWRGIRHLL
jgi:hypothetical protein